MLGTRLLLFPTDEALRRQINMEDAEFEDQLNGYEHLKHNCLDRLDGTECLAIDSPSQAYDLG